MSGHAAGWQIYRARSLRDAEDIGARGPGATAAHYSPVAYHHSAAPRQTRPCGYSDIADQLCIVCCSCCRVFISKTLTSRWLGSWLARIVLEVITYRFGMDVNATTFRYGDCKLGLVRICG